MRRYIAYTRVSTARQGEKGSSLPEQKSIIESYARREGLAISTWFEERETAAKVGRTIFKQMMQVFSKGGAEGLILHKIDRGARNLKDWALLSELTDKGVDVRIAGDSIDMTSRGGRLSADIQAVVAADYIRNLREEVKKGQKGRLKAGLYPWAAPLGYLDTGEGGKAKIIDPQTGPLIRRAFEEYASGKHTLVSLAKAMHGWGIKAKAGNPMSKNRVNVMLRRQFYVGLIRVTGSTYLGIHEALISKELFDAVQDTLDGRSSVRVFGQRKYSLKRVIKCGSCGRYLYAETQKEKIYYRCHTTGCCGTCIRESALLDYTLQDIAVMGLSEHFTQLCRYAIEDIRSQALASCEARKQSNALRLSSLSSRLAALTDAYLDRILGKEDFELRKSQLLMEQVTLRQELMDLAAPEKIIDRKATRFFELIKGLISLKDLDKPDEKRKVLQEAVSNFSISGKTLVLQWKYPLQLLIQATPVLVSGPTRNRTSTNSFGDCCSATKL